MENKVVGVDIGGTNLRAALVDGSGNIMKRQSTASQASKGINFVLKNLVNVLQEITEGEKISRVGIGVPGIVYSTRGIITRAPNLYNVDNYPMRDILTEELGSGISVFVENDANCAALGEWWIGEGKDVNSLVLLAIGTGLGGGIVLDNKLWCGVDGMAGEVGHTTIYPDGPKCKCGNIGCLETYASAVGIRRMIKEGLADTNLKTLVREKVKTASKERVPEIIREAAIQGDKFALWIWEGFGRALGIGIANLVNLLNMEMIVISGGLSNSWEMFMDIAIGEAKKRAWSAPMERVKIRRTVLGDDAGLLGAAYLALEGRGAV
ncbi:MAG TPA: ROK family protein [Thermodesulfobacteriota bacterium]|nr:ROK family protein [Thermodesulfobacteriota bacterium]